MSSNSLLVKLNHLPKYQKDINKIKKEFLLNDIKYKELLNFETPTNLNLKTSKITTEIPVGRSYSINKYDEFGFEEKRPQHLWKSITRKTSSEEKNQDEHTGRLELSA